MNKRVYLAAFSFVAAILVPSHAATFFGPLPYLSRADIPVGLYVSGGPTVLENFEDGNLDPSIAASQGGIIPPGFEGSIDSVDADDGVIDGSGVKGHSWFAGGLPGVKFAFPPGTIAAGVVWTDGNDGITFSAFGPGHVPLGMIGPFNGIAGVGFSGETAEDRFFGVRDAGGVESIVITCAQAGGLELDHVQYELASASPKQDYLMDWHSIGPTAQSAGGDFSLMGSLGHPVAGQISGGDYALNAGFEDAPGVIVPESVVIFDNTGGSSNGYESATTQNWLAEKFCVGGQPYGLDSLSLLLVSGDNNGEPRLRSVRLRIYANDPVAGTPALDTGVIMNLAEATNPITLPIGFTEAPIEWRPATRFILAPNQCYWAVLSTEVGIVSEPASATMPTGDAASFGRASSSDAGATWNGPDNFTSRKMLIRGAPVEAGEGASSIPIFDNTGGSDNGGFGVTESNWLASKFCLGSQSYGLDSVSLLLNSQDSSGQPGPPSTVRLQIYADDPVSGKPAASTGRIMNLSDLTNPITPPPRGLGLVKWIPATPFVLSADTCYWAVLSRESGGSIGQIASVTKPTGDAGTFGGTSSVNAGATWVTPDPGTNFKMLIQGTASATPLPTPDLTADGSTAIPGGTGNFTSLPLAPSLSGNDLVFYGAGSGGQQGIYQSTRGSGKTPSRIADLATAIPGGTGNFLSFGAEAGIIIVGGAVLFHGHGSGSQQGIYLSSRAISGEPIRIADTATAIPGGSGNFMEFPTEPSISGNNVVFAGNGAGGQRGIYAALMTPPQVGSPLRVADTATAIPGGSGNFTEFPSGPSISGNNAVFAGNGTGGQRGVYAALMTPPQVGSPRRVADTATAIPGGSGNFTEFPSEPSISGNNVVFAGNGTGGQRGVYAALMTPPQVGSPLRIADTTTPIPAGGGNFASFSAVSVSETDVAFLGHGAAGETGIYDMTGGQLLKVIAVGDRIGGKAITGLNFSRTGLSGDPVAFQATFSDGSEGVYTMDVLPPPSELRITAVSISGNDLRISFPAISGRSYAIENLADLKSEKWEMLPGSAISSAGGTVQIAVPIRLDQPQQFYRVQILP